MIKIRKICGFIQETMKIEFSAELIENAKKKFNTTKISPEMFITIFCMKKVIFVYPNLVYRLSIHH